MSKTAKKNEKQEEQKWHIVRNSDFRLRGFTKDKAYDILQGFVSQGLGEWLRHGMYRVNDEAYEEIEKLFESLKPTCDTVTEMESQDQNIVPSMKEKELCLDNINADNITPTHQSAVSIITKMRKEIDKAYDWRSIYTDIFKSECPTLIQGESIVLKPTKDWEYTAFLHLTDTHADTDKLMTLLPKMASVLSDVPGILTKIVIVVTGDMMDNTHLFPGQSFMATHNNARQQVHSFIHVIKTIEFLERFAVDNAADDVEIIVTWCLGNHTREAPFAKGGPANQFDNWEHGLMLLVAEYMKNIGSKAKFYAPDYHNRGYLEVPTVEESGAKKTATEMWPFMTFYSGNCVVGMTHGHIVRMNNKTPHYGIEHAIQQWNNQLRPEDHIRPKLFFMGHFHRSMSDVIHGTHFYMGGTLQDINAHSVRFAGSSYLSQNLVIWKTSHDVCEWGFHRLLVQ